MLIITDRQAVDQAFASKTPRPFREVVLEVYPDAVEDANGRFHAPHDGYECPFSGKLFRGGEYLPTEEVEDPFERALRAPGAVRNFPRGRTLDGQVFSWEGTRAQELAAWAELIKQTREHEAKTSCHVDEVGKMTNLADLELQFVKGFEGFYGTVWLHVMKDPSGNVVVYKGSKRLRTGPNPYLDKDLQKGGKVSLRCKIKAHSDREGVAQTIVERPKVIEATQ